MDLNSISILFLSPSEQVLLATTYVRDWMADYDSNSQNGLALPNEQESPQSCHSEGFLVPYTWQNTSRNITCEE